MSDGSAIHMSAAEGSRNWYSPLLAPISRVYGAGVELRTALYKGRWLEAKRLNRPVVSVGNLTAGGTGKTPLVILLAKMLEQAGRKPSILTRGYKRRSRESCIVIEPGRERQPDSDEVGDEPALLARRLTQVPLVVSADRYSAGRLAESRFGVDLHLLDDGFQHLHLHRDIDVLVIDSTQPFASGQLLPAGRLRERPVAARRADLIVITRGDPKANQRIAATLEGFGIRRPTFTARTRLCGLAPVNSPGELPRLPSAEQRLRPVLAFCGLGNPDAFFRDLERWGFSLAGQLAFSDHHRYDRSEVQRLLDQAKASGAEWLLTTEKDVQNISEPRTGSLPLFYCSMELEIPEEDSFRREIFSRLGKVEEGKGK